MRLNQGLDCYNFLFIVYTMIKMHWYKAEGCKIEDPPPTHTHTGPWSVLRGHLTLSVLELEKCSLHKNEVEFHQKLIGTIVRH